MKLKLISTFSDSSYDKYSHYFVNSLIKHLDKKIEVILYTDNIVIDKNNIKSINLNSVYPDLVKFKERNKDKDNSIFLFDAVRFAHKSYAIAHAGLTSDCDYLFWLDADTELISFVSEDYLLSKIDKDVFTSYLGRKTFTETGFLSFNLKHNNSNLFFQKIKEYYDTDKIYNLPGYTDCHVYDKVRKEMISNNQITQKNISPPNVKHHFGSLFLNHIFHYKGNKKDNRERHLKKAGVKF